MWKTFLLIPTVLWGLLTLGLLVGSFFVSPDAWLGSAWWGAVGGLGLLSGVAFISIIARIRWKPAALLLSLNLGLLLLCHFFRPLVDEWAHLRFKFWERQYQAVVQLAQAEDAALSSNIDATLWYGGDGLANRQMPAHYAPLGRGGAVRVRAVDGGYRLFFYTAFLKSLGSGGISLGYLYRADDQLPAPTPVGTDYLDFSGVRFSHLGCHRMQPKWFYCYVVLP